MKRTCVLSVLMVLSLLVFLVTPSLAADFNYAEALQKALYFYECQRSGALPPGNRVEWRGNSGMQDGADVGHDLTGGWYDAGDHVKFGLPLAYTATVLGWAVYEYRDAFADAGLLENALDNIKWATDYIIKCHTAPYEFYYQVGNGHWDHAWWGPAEVMPMERPSYKVTLNSPGSAVVAESAAALAVASIIFKPTNPSYAALCLQHAEQLFDFADRTKSDAGYTAANGFYDSWSGFWDELSWAGAWLYLATGKQTYLDKAEEYVQHWEREPQSDIIGYKWAHCWDNKLYGTQILLARITGKDLYITSTERHLDYWSVGYNGERITYTPGGLAWLDTWGALRYATTTAFLAFVYGDWVNDPVKKERYHSFAERQVRYALGDNPRKSSYVVGFGVNPPQRPHHRTSHGSWADSMNVPPYHRHILYGALVGGPNSSDGYTDDISDYVCNEVACDYNAGFVGALAKMYTKYGGTILPNFPPPETRDDEFFVEAGVNAWGTNFTEIRAYLNNRSGWPARVGDSLSFKYFMDLSEVFAAGYTLNDLTLTTNHNEGAKLSGIFPWDTDRHIYYVVLDFTGTKIYPGGQSAHRKEVQFRIAMPSGTNVWDPENDWSYQGLRSGSLIKTPYIPVYDNGVLLWGEEPKGGGLPTPTPTTPGPTPTPTPRPTPTPTTPGPTPTPTPTSTVAPGQVRVEARREESNPNVQSLIRMNVWNESTAALNNLSARYFVDLSEVYAAGYSADHVTIDIYYSSAGVTVSPLTAYDAANRIYYFELNWGSYSLAPGGRIEANFSIHLNGWQPAWNPANDWSYQGLSSSYTNTSYIPIYRAGTLIYGLEPGGAPPPTPTPTVPGPTPTPTATPRPTPTPTPTPTTPGPTPTPTPTVKPTPTPTPTSPPAGDYVVVYDIGDDWGSGATINVTIINNTSSAVNGWTLEWTFPGNQQITNLWCGSHTQTGASVSVSDAGWNALIPANGGSVNFGFNINYSGANNKPTAFTLNGVPCSIQ